MICVSCASGEARTLRVTRTYGTGPQTLMIENMPIVSCPTCGECYTTADTLHAIDTLRAQRERLAEIRCVAVVRFDAA